MSGFVCFLIVLLVFHISRNILWKKGIISRRIPLNFIAFLKLIPRYVLNLIVIICITFVIFYTTNSTKKMCILQH